MYKRQTITPELAYRIEQEGVNTAVIVTPEDKTVKVYSNGMVDIGEYVPMFTDAELEDSGINEKVRFTVLQEVLEKCGDDKDALSEERSARCDDLIPKHIIIDDIMASINYLNCIADGVGTTDDIDPVSYTHLENTAQSTYMMISPFAPSSMAVIVPCAVSVAVLPV